MQNPEALAVIEVDLANWRNPEKGAQVWIKLRKVESSRFFALPSAPTVRVLVLDAESSALDSAPFRVTVGGINRDAASLLGFLSSGDFESARRVGRSVLETAETMLREKLDDPISATIAGYFLLRAGELDRLHDWTRNLANWFEWLPDGPVIRAWHLLSLKQPSFGEIRDSFFEAVDRGVPFFTQGFRLLYDGLVLLNQQGPDSSSKKPWIEFAPTPAPRCGARPSLLLKAMSQTRPA
jgi:hypothetical protein